MGQSKVYVHAETLPRYLSESYVLFNWEFTLHEYDLCDGTPSLSTGK